MYEIRGTPTSITVLEDEYLTVFSYQRMYMRHQFGAWSGTFTYLGHTVPWTAYTSNTPFIASGLSNMLSRNKLPNRATIRRRNITNSLSNQWSDVLLGDPVYNFDNRSCFNEFNFNPLVTEMTYDYITLRSMSFNFIFIFPDWSVLPEEHRFFATNPDKWVLRVPEGQRLQGSLSWSFFRGD